MQVFDTLQAYREQQHQCVATIGKYDGMHLGHQQLLTVLRDEARRLGLPSVVILSEPHPEEFFAGPAAPPRLQRFADKVDFLDEFGIDIVYCLRFDDALRQMLAEDFIRSILVDGLGIASLVVGDDFSFGHGREGNIALLQAYGKQCGFSVHQVGGQYLDEQRISSTRVRELLAAGDCAGVETLLGRPFSISGPVVQGRQLGRELGFPTANLTLGQARLPLRGVFAVRVDGPGGSYEGVANIGYRPTVDDSEQAHLEVHLLDVDKDLYGETLRVHFLQRLRDEEKFPDIDSLQRQIAADVAQARQWFARQGTKEAGQT